jgi:hypothetical protein
MMDDQRRGTRDETTPRSVGRVLCLTSPRTCRTFELLFFLVSICALPMLKRGPASPPSRFVSFSLHPVSLDIPGSANTLDCRPLHGLIRRPIRDPKTRRRCLYRCRKLKRPLGPSLPSATLRCLLKSPLSTDHDSDLSATYRAHDTHVPQSDTHRSESLLFKAQILLSPLWKNPEISSG